VATCNPGGAGTWRADFGRWFKGCKGVVVVADNDAGAECGAKEYWQGQRHATAVLQSLRDAGVAAWALTMPAVGDKPVKDAADWIAVPVPPLIDEADFDLVQASLAARNPKKAPPRIISSPTLLTGLAKCGTCGSGMTLRRRRMRIEPGCAARLHRTTFPLLTKRT
jgi:hypothetical protein